MPSPAEIVRACLVLQDLVIMPEDGNLQVPYQQIPDDGSIVCFVGSMPDEVDNALLLRDVVGMISGRRMDGKYMVHCGIKCLLRHLLFDYDQVNTLFGALTAIRDFAVEMDKVEHFIKTIYRTSTIIPLGEEVGKRRQEWSLNVRVAMQDNEPATG